VSEPAGRGLKEAGDEGNGKADDVEVIAFNAGIQRAARPGWIGSGFVHGFAGSDVGGDFFVGEGKELDGGGFGGDFSVCAVTTATPVMTRWVRPERDGAYGRRRGFGLAEDVIVEGYGGVGARTVRVSGRTTSGLKPPAPFGAFAARLKSCPDTGPIREDRLGFFRARRVT